MAHALTAYVTKPLHLLGVIDLGFHGWKTPTRSRVPWDLLFYEPWFLALGLLVTPARCTTTAGPAVRLRPAAAHRDHRRRRR